MTGDDKVALPQSMAKSKGILQTLYRLRIKAAIFN
jgi:hypothetical protein